MADTDWIQSTIQPKYSYMMYRVKKGQIWLKYTYGVGHKAYIIPFGKLPEDLKRNKLFRDLIHK